MSMKTKMPYLLTLATAVTMTACQSQPISKPEKNETTAESQKQTSSMPSTTSDSDNKKVSEALGNFIGRNLKSPGIEFDVESIIQGLRNGAAGKPSPMTDEEYEAAMLALQQKAIESLSTTNLDTANKFITENANTKGVVEIIPGKLQYMILEEGKGEAVPEHGTPTINYTGKFADGTVFGTSENSDGPISVSLDNTVPGFSKGIAGMKEGEKRRLFVHPDVGYGKGGQLPPNSLLIFDVEVVKANTPQDDNANQDEDLGDLDESIDEEKTDEKENDKKHDKVKDETK